MAEYTLGSSVSHDHVNNNSVSDHNVSNIVDALEIIHSRTSTNELRYRASQFLESQKREKSAAHNGYFLASQRNNSPLLRHFGLSLLEHVLKHRSTGLSATEFGHLKELILNLAQDLLVHDPSYIRNKVAVLWVEIAKRSWGIDWLDMDESLVKLWGSTLTHKEFVLSILETLSEDIIHHEDTISSLRGTDLNRALVEIFTPYSVLKGTYPERGHHAQLRYGSDGWLFRICDFLNECMQNIHSSMEVKVCALKALAALRSVMIWSMPQAVFSCQCVPTLCRVLTSQDDELLMAAVEALHALYGRSCYEIDEFQGLINLMYQTDNLVLLRKLYEWSVVDANGILESKYTISKKLSELVSYIAGFLEEQGFVLHKEIDLSSFFPFLISIVRHQSLTVSIPVLHSWSRLLMSDTAGTRDVVASLTAPLLETCTQRLVHYENFPEDSNDPTILFLNEDIDTLPERHAFVGNYRRYCSQVIELIVQKRPHEAIPHILSRADFILDNLYKGVAPFYASVFEKHTIPLLQADMQFSVVEATLRGYNKWVDTHGKMPQQDERQRCVLEATLESWALNLMRKKFEDPIILQRVIRLSVDFSAKALENKPSFALKVLEHILMTDIVDHPEFPLYSESVKELHNLATQEVRRLATRYADYFSTFYDVLELKVREIMARPDRGENPQIELSSILLIVMQRAGDVDPYIRQSRLKSFVEPIKAAWASEEFKCMSSSFDGFCQMLGIEGVCSYLQARDVQKIGDWATIALDDEGKNIQAQMTSKFQLLPLRATKTMLAVSTERLKRTDPAYQIACELWCEIIPVVLPTLLQIISHAHAFHNPDNWSGLPEEMWPVVGRILTDRFWQAGISTGSREEFYARITTSKATLEGFSSSVRGKIRAAREACYSILYSMSRLREYFYGFEELSVHLAQALFADATYLSSHQFSMLINISRCLVDDCPARFRAHFLPPMLSTLFARVDKKITTEWDALERRKLGMANGDLTEEMKDESILRQLTYSVVIMVASLLDPQRGDPDNGTEATDPNSQTATSDSIRRFILSSPQIFEPVILFCTHAIRMRDTRCCGIITRVIRSILKVFAPPVNTPTAVTIREFICNDILKACITSVHEPYFVDLHKELAQLIASIWILYGSASNTARSIMLSLPGMSASRVAATEDALMRSSSTRQQKALVLDLLEGLRGVSISEQGRISGRPEDRRKARSAMQARYMMVEMEGQESGKVDTNNGPDLSGIAAMFS